jgi:anaerobic selenocysteine-containing dehydrogenase
MKICPEPTLKMSAETAGKLGLKEGDRVQFSTTAGSSEAPASIDESIKDNRVFLSNNFPGRGVMDLLSFSIDEVTKASGIEGCEVEIKKHGIKA